MTENKCLFCENTITAHHSFTYVCENCRGIIKRLKKHQNDLKNAMIRAWGSIEEAKDTPTELEYRDIQKILRKKK